MKLLGLFLAVMVGLTTADKIVCHFASWAVYRPGQGRFDVEDVDPFLCTHLIFSYAGLSNETWEIEVLDPWNELCPPEEGGNHCAYKRFVNLKDQNPDLTVLLAIGGSNEGSTDYSEMAKDEVKRSRFIESAVALLKKQRFEGLDFDWQYPNARGGVPEDKENFVKLITELRAAFQEVTPPLMLTGTLPGDRPTLDGGYDIPSLEPLFDQFHIMTFNYHGPWEDFTHHSAPVCRYYQDTGESEYLNVHSTVNYLLDRGIQKEKMVLGAAMYGLCFTLDNIMEHNMLAPAHKPGKAGPYVRIPGHLAVNEICLRLKDPTCTVVHDPNLHEPYIYCENDNIWCGFDDEDSYRLKARYAKNMGLAGIMIMSLDEDNFSGECDGLKFDNVITMKKAFEEPAGADILKCDGSNTMESTTTMEATAAPPGGRPDCTGYPDGTTLPHVDCNKYWECISKEFVLRMCAPGTVFDKSLNTCNWEEVDVTDCRMWDCSVNGTKYPAVSCNQYYWCYNGTPQLETCPPPLYWRQSILRCDDPSKVDTSLCS